MQKPPGWAATYEFVPIGFASGIPLKLLNPNRSELKPDPILVIHAHDQLEIGYCYTGSGIWLVEGQVHPFSAGTVSVFLPGQNHRAQASPGQFCQWNFLWVDLKSLLAPLPIPEIVIVHHPLFPEDQHPLLNLLTRNVLGELEAGRPGDDPVVRGLLWAIAGLLGQAAPRDGAPPRPSREIHRITPALDRIARQYHEPVAIPDLADLCGMSLNTFRRHFFEAVGQTPHAYLTEVRIQLASLMLLQEGSILETAMAVGYESASTFYRHFHRLKGMSPQEWKARGRLPSR